MRAWMCVGTCGVGLPLIRVLTFELGVTLIFEENRECLVE